MPFFKMIFSWWNSATLGTWLMTKMQGEPVGTDTFGNRYFQNKDGSRRWVLYNGTVEASRVPPNGMAGCTTPMPSRRPGRRSRPVASRSRISPI